MNGSIRNKTTTYLSEYFKIFSLIIYILRHSYFCRHIIFMTLRNRKPGQSHILLRNVHSELLGMFKTTFNSSWRCLSFIQRLTNTWEYDLWNETRTATKYCKFSGIPWMLLQTLGLHEGKTFWDLDYSNNPSKDP